MLPPEGNHRQTRASQIQSPRAIERGSTITRRAVNAPASASLKWTASRQKSAAASMNVGGYGIGSGIGHGRCGLRWATLGAGPRAANAGNG